MILRGADEFIDLAEVGVDESLSEQTVVHVWKRDRRAGTGHNSCVRRAGDVGGRALQRH